MAEEDFRAWERLCELIWSCAASQAIHVFVDLGIPEILNAGPMPADQLATITGADEWALQTVLRALATMDIVSIEREQRYALTPMGRFLLRSTPGSSAGEAGEFFETIYRPLGDLMHMVKTGQIAFHHVYGKSFYDHLQENSGLATHFYNTMEATALQRYAGLSSVFQFAERSRIVDVGGGEGSLLIQILRECQNSKGVLYDLPLLTERAKARLRAAGLSERCEIAAGNFLESVPSGGDVYILANVLNNWRTEDAERVLANCHAAMHECARLLVLEPIYVPGTLPRWRALVSLGVMAQRGGRTRSEAEIRALLAAGGFQVESIVQLPSSTTYAITANPL
jgi:hypothetical protein